MCFILRKKALAILSSAVVIIIIIGFGISFFREPSEEDIVLAREKIEDVFYETDGNQDIFTKSIDEQRIQQIIHEMSHQKVKAKQKWGAILITQDRVGELIEVTESSENWEHREVYLDILYRWYDGDFSQADKDHNAIWKLQGGTIGKASGLLNAIEEKKFISNLK